MARYEKFKVNIMDIMIIGGNDVNARIELIKIINKKYSVCCVGSSKKIGAYFQNDGIKYYSYELSNTYNVYKYLSSLVQLIIIIKKVKPKLVLTFDTIPNTIARLAARFCYVKSVLGTQPGLGIIRRHEDKVINKIAKKIAVFAIKLMNNISDMTIYQNKDDIDFMIVNKLVNRSKSQLILSSGVNTSYFKPQGKNIKLNKKNKTEINIIMISRLLKSKGIKQYWNLAKNLIDEFHYVNFHHLGEIVLRHFDSLKNEEIEQFKNHISFHGQVDDVRDFLYKSDIMVLPTTYAEGVPRVLLEAASVGLPLVAYDVPGCREVVIHGKNGFLVEPNNDQELIKNVAILVKDEKLRKSFGQKSIEIIRERFDINLIAYQYLSTFDRYLQR